jgi:Flp pilus assembly protein TadG
MLRTLAKFHYDSRGGVLIFFGFAVALLITAMGIAIDMGRVFIVRSKAQTALDAAVVATAAISTGGIGGEELQARGEAYFDANFPPGYLDVASVEPTFTQVADTDGASVRGEVDIQMQTLFGPLIDALLPESQAVTDVDMNVFSQVDRIMSPVTLEISMVLDHTASMCFNESDSFDSSYCEANPGKLRALVDSVDNLMTTINAAMAATDNPDAKAYYAYVPFVQSVRRNGVMLHDNIHPDHVARGANYDFLPSIRGLSDDTDAIIADMNSVFGTINKIGGTNTAHGTLFGWRALRPDSVGFFEGVSAHEFDPSPLGTEGVYKILILMTDGKNEFTENRNNPLRGCNDPLCLFDDEYADMMQESMCEDIKKEGIDVYSIVFMEDDATINDLFRGCANPAENFYSVDSPAELRAAFESIANDLIDLRITR